MFSKILVANRGEIALRIMRACRELDIRTVAVYSEADRECAHVAFADEQICIGPPPPVESYLNIPRIITAAEITDADAIHPGYGFLAENSHFAEVCESCHIKFIGPPISAVEAMGEKSNARDIMKINNIPTVPGSEGVIKTIEEAIRLANQIGYPVIVKAAGGGGGRGMRIAHTDVSLSQAFTTAKTEAEIAFANGDLYIEKYIEKPRHVEIQILADEHGNVLHLGERDCSLQRRYQKIVEESPSPAVDIDMYMKMGEVAVRCAKAVNYTSAGTVEFLLTADKNFYFMEMNTRIQVEHPVTEVVTGIDLIKEQIRAAAGEKLRFDQSQIKRRGHAIECRINAEDPSRGFRPSPGKIVTYHPPGGPGIRVDSHIYQDYVVPPNYDSLIAKLIAYGEDRWEALKRMQRALHEIVIDGINTNIHFHQLIFNDRNFLKGDVHTKYIDELLTFNE